MPHLSFAELIARDVPLTAVEAVSLTLAAAAARDRRPDGHCVALFDEILLSSSGDVTFASRVSKHDENDAAWLTSLLCRLLGLDEAEDRARCRGRVPGGLLVLVARMRGQIDLPPLSPDAFLSSLKRFSAGPESSLLAAVFWRAARMRSRQPDAAATTARAHSHASAERRRRGPSASELRRWLRETERELFAIQQRRAPIGVVMRHVTGIALRPTSAIAIASVAMGLALWFYAPRRVQLVAAPSPSMVVLDEAAARPMAMAVPTRTALGTTARPGALPQPAGLVVGVRQSETSAKPVGMAKVRRSSHQAGTKTVQAPSKRASTVRTVHLVNLPRASWAVVQTTSSVRSVRAVPVTRPNTKVPASNYSNRYGRRQTP